MAQNKSLRGAKVVQGAKLSPGGQLPPHFPRLCTMLYVDERLYVKSCGWNLKLKFQIVVNFS